MSGRSYDGQPVSGYEMHMGVTTGPDCARPFVRLSDGRHDGAVSMNRQVIGTYMHGLFSDDQQRAAWLMLLESGPTSINHEILVAQTLDRLAAHPDAIVLLSPKARSTLTRSQC